MTKPRQAEGSTGCLDLPAAGPFWDRSSARSWYRVPNGSGLTDLSAIADLLFSLGGALASLLQRIFPAPNSGPRNRMEVVGVQKDNKGL